MRLTATPSKVGSPTETYPAIEALEAAVATEARGLVFPGVLVDPHSKDTVDNARRAFAHLTALGAAAACRWELTVVTCDWHLARAVAIFWQEEPPGVCHQLLAVVARSSAGDLQELREKHLVDARYHLRYFKPDGTTDALRARYTRRFGWADLLAVGRNLRALELLHPPPTVAAAETARVLNAVRLGSPGADAGARSLARIGVVGAMARLFFGAPNHNGFYTGVGTVAPSLAIHSNGSGPLHFAASFGLEELCLDLMGLFGCSAYHRNSTGWTPAEYARRAGHEDLAVLLDDAARLQLLHDSTAE